MLTIYGLSDAHLVTSMLAATPPPDCRAVWFDLLEPTPEEDRQAEAMLGVSIPTRDEMQEIEASSRLYVEDGALFMTALIPVQSETETPRSTPVTFILLGDRLATVRYDRPRSFEIFRARAERPGAELVDGRSILIGLLETIIDRVADGLERIAADIDHLSTAVFRPRGQREKDLETALTNIGRLGGAVARYEDSIVSLARLFHFLGEANGNDRLDRDGLARLATLGHDARSLADHAKSLDSKVNFLLSATLGLVALEQNTIVKIFSILAVVFMPPTLIASIYGMNFHAMPELDWTWGYPMALGLMVASVATTFTVFKWRRWL
ncbi:magnesium transporter [Siculibacillus lacustris]|uniref:Magnesium transport protein CorA n=1 Tax=Siculibacillus lacustris TaxID=1549641 RepID=A0A4Q9VJD2_9HYPH|nr:magnesium transporter CorA family protein [Siculibacillus lacustris]TBW34514.1 magnesium transporter [Siculibacillus lacustris]